MIEIKQSELTQILIDIDSCIEIHETMMKTFGSGTFSKLLIDRLKKDSEIIKKLMEELKK